MGGVEHRREYLNKRNKPNMIETETATIQNPLLEESNNGKERFPGKGKKCLVIEEDYSDFEPEVNEYECPICDQCGCQSEKCELEMERQEYMAEYWADF